MKLTKITCSIGPSSESAANLEAMVDAGMNVCRLNFSHDEQAVHAQKIKTIRELSAKIGKPIAVLADMQGPKHRIGDFAITKSVEGKTTRTILEIGQTFTFDSNPELGDNKRVQLPDSEVLKSLKVGDRVLLNDGKMEMIITEKRDGAVDARVLRGTEIWDRRGFNLPDTEIESSVLTEKDRGDLDFVLKHDPDFIAISFVQKPEDVIETREFIAARTNRPVKIVVKIERPQAIERIEEIVKLADAVMFARGDLAVEVPFENVPVIARRVIKICRQYNKPFIMATQMLGGMLKDEFPTRAEVSDIATAAFMKVDSTMTSEETTIGDHPILVVDTMARVLSATDADVIAKRDPTRFSLQTEENAWSESVAAMSILNKVDVIVVFTISGDKVRAISARRPNAQIVAVAESDIIANQLCLSRSVIPVCDSEIYQNKDVVAAMKRAGVESERVIIINEDGSVKM